MGHPSGSHNSYASAKFKLAMASSISWVFLEADRGAIYPRVLESEPHCFHTIVMTILELTATAQLHADHTQPFLLQCVDVINHFAHIVWMVGVLYTSVRPCVSRCG